MNSILKENKNAQKLTGFESFLVTETSELKTGVDAVGQPTEYKDVWLNTAGSTRIKRFNFTTFTGADGQKHSLWLEVSDTKPRK